MDFSVLELLKIIGALGFFIYGMKVMSDGIQKVAGQKLRNILSAMTSHRILGVMTGFLITALVQSSSATTVMVVSFVNAGLLSLTESIGVIMGANIGTTVTAWLISIFGFKVKIASVALPIIGIGFPFLFSNKSTWKSWAEVLIGFAFVFMGLDELKNSVPDLRSNPEILEFLAAYTDLGFASTLLFVGIGTILTIIVQSSSAAMALTLVMCNQGWIPFHIAAAIVMGENIGTTITANLAAMVGNVHAKRAARAHLIFNLFGVVWMLVLLQPFLRGIDGYMQQTEGVSPFASAAAIPIALSVFHTSFNIMNVLLLVWFVKPIEHLVTRLVKSKGDEDEVFTLEYIGAGMMGTPELSMLEAKKELSKFGKLTRKMFEQLRALLTETDKKEFKRRIERINNYEEVTDRIEVEIIDYLQSVSEGELSDKGSTRVRSMLSIAADLENVGDVLRKMSSIFEIKASEKAWFTPEQRDNLSVMFDHVNKALLIMQSNLDRNYEDINLEEAGEEELSINKFRNKLRKKHLKSIEKGDYNIRAGMLYVDLFTNLEKLGDHIVNVSKAAKGEDD
jgi:phosphate:Na+ symporter